VVRTVTAALIEQYEPFLFQQRVHLRETDAAGTVLHPQNKFITLGHGVHTIFRKAAKTVQDNLAY
jgi:hypothetical protein